jgi:hypothetical protein
MEQNLDDIFTNMMNGFNFPQTQHTSPLNVNNPPQNQNNPTNPSRNQNIPANPSMRYVNRQLDTIYDLMIHYNDNMIQYQRNMTQMVSLININNSTFQQRLHEIRSDRNTQPNNRRHVYRNVPSTQRTPQPPLFTNRQNHILTQHEIRNLTTIFTYNNTTSAELSETRCPISLDNFREGDVLCKINGCNHVFKKDNLLNWFRRNSKCPICRFNLHDALHMNRPPDNSRGRTNPTSHTNQSGGTMRDASGNRLDISNNIYTATADADETLEEITNMLQNFINGSFADDTYNLDIGDRENYFDISFNIRPLYQTENEENTEENVEENVEENEEENVEENIEENEEEDDDSSVIPDNLSVD